MSKLIMVRALASLAQIARLTRIARMTAQLADPVQEDADVLDVRGQSGQRLHPSVRGRATADRAQQSPGYVTERPNTLFQALSVHRHVFAEWHSQGAARCAED